MIETSKLDEQEEVVEIATRKKYVVAIDLRGGGGGGVDGGSPCRMSILRNDNVALSILRKSCVANKWKQRFLK